MDHPRPFQFNEVLKNISLDDYTPSFPVHRSPTRPGDVIFTRSSKRDSIASCVIQTIINPRYKDFYSHVAVVLSGDIVIEAFTEPEDDSQPWSNVILRGGVRIRLLPDLIFSAKTWKALRHPKATVETESQFTIRTPHVSFMYGSGYDLKALNQSKLLSSKVVKHFADKWKADPDEISQMLRDDPKFAAELEKHLPEGELLYASKNFFCSQLAGILLFRGGLLPHDPGPLTPCGLYDHVTKAGWHDVTNADYGADTIASWKQRSLANWQLNYEETVAFAGFFRDAVHSNLAIADVGRILDDFSSRLQFLAKGFDKRRE